MELVQEGSMRFDVLEPPDCGSTVPVGRFGADEPPRPSVTHFALPEKPGGLRRFGGGSLCLNHPELVPKHTTYLVSPVTL